MYKLNSGCVDNSIYIKALESFDSLKNNIKDVRTLYNVQEDLFSSHFNEDDYDELACAITMGDELSVPISYEEAKVLWFTLNVNVNNVDSKIRSITKAYLFYQEFDGDHEKVIFINTKSSIIHIAKIFYKDIIPGITIQYKIPFYVVNNKHGYYFTIAECDRYTVLINDQAQHITRKSFNRLLNSNYAKSFRNHEEVMNSIDCSTNILLDCLEDALFTKRIVDYPFNNNSSCLEVSSDNTIYAWDSPKVEPEHWVAKNSNKYQLDVRYNNIVALCPNDSKMIIYVT